MPPASKKHPISPDSTIAGASKTPRLDDAPTGLPTATAGARKKLVGAPPRTGQACDRCKSRKIRCDDTQGGCLPCIQSNTECRTTDRITHRATARGHTESLERDVNMLRHHVIELEHQLKELGVEPRSLSQYIPAREPFSNDWRSATGVHGLGPGWDQGGNSAILPEQEHTESRPQEANMFALPAFRAGLHGDNYLGVSPANDTLSLVKGTSLSLFGMPIDISDYMTDGVDDNINCHMTYDSVISSLFGRGPPKDIGVKAELPKTYEEMAGYAHWYYTVVLPFCPMLHKPAFEELIVKLYQGYQPTVVEDVMVHMVLAYMKFQTAFRNERNSEEYSIIMRQSLAHFHYSLGFYGVLAKARTVEAMQALVMICSLIRSFPKPGAAWNAICAAMSMAIEMGIHRSAKAWVKDSSKKDILEIEMRKRIWWTLLVFAVAISGKLGRPMPVRLVDFDVEMPEPLNENLQRAEGGPGPHQCTFHGAIEFYKLTTLFLEAYSSIYAIRPTQNYEATVRRIEIGMQKWKRELPALVSESALSSAADSEPNGATRILAMWMVYWECELQLLVHHPALCTSKSPDAINHNLTVCMEAASKLIQMAVDLWNVKCLDTTWANLTTFLGAIFTLLFAMWERRDQITSADLAKLEHDMEVCMGITGEIGAMLGSGSRLKEAMLEIVVPALARIRRFHVERTASAAVASAASATAALKQSPSRSPNQAHEAGNKLRKSSGAASGTFTAAHNLEQKLPAQARGTGYVANNDPSMPHSQAPYPSAPPGNYPNPATSSIPSYAYQSYSPEASSYHVSDIGMTNHAPLQTPEAFLYNAGAATAYQQAQQQGFEGQMAWRQWVENARSGHEAPEYMNPANALMALGGRDHGSPQPGHGLPYVGSMAGQAIPHLLPNTNLATAVQPQQWPLGVFDTAPNRNVQLS